MADPPHALTSGNLQASYLVGTALFALVVYMTLVAQRPFFVLLDTPESFYYYNSRAILESLRPDTVTHPGTPVFYLGALLLLIVGTNPDTTQLFLNIGYFIAVLATIGSLFVFARIVLKGVPFSISLLTLSSVAVWPPVATYLNHWSTESFFPAATLITLAFFWKALGSHAPSRRTLVAVGLGIGAGTALKAAFLPLALALLGSLIVHHLRVASTGGSRTAVLWATVRRLTVTVLAALGAFVALTWPTLPQMHFVLSKIVAKGDPIRSPLESVGAATGDFFTTAPSFFPVVLVALATVAFVGVRVRKQRSRPDLDQPGDLDRTALVAFVGLALAGFIYAIWLNVPIYDAADPQDPGIRLKNVTPLALATVVAIPLLFHTLPPGIQRLASGWTATYAIVGLAALVVLVGFWKYGSFRSDVYGALEQSILGREAAVETIVSGEGRIALGPGGTYDWGSAAFHLYGNHDYTADRFDDQLLDHFPRYTIVRMDQVDELAAQACGLGVSTVVPRQVGLLRGPFQAPFDWWREAVPRPARDDKLVTGEGSGAGFDAVIYRTRRASVNAALRCAFEARFGPMDSSVVSISGEEWIVLRPSS